MQIMFYSVIPKRYILPDKMMFRDVSPPGNRQLLYITTLHDCSIMLMFGVQIPRSTPIFERNKVCCFSKNVVVACEKNLLVFLNTFLLELRG